MIAPRPNYRVATIAMALLASAPIRAEQLGVGAVAMPKPALSVQWQPEARMAWHIATHYDATHVLADGDYQRFLPLGAGARRAAVYSGIGLRGESQRDEHASEIYKLRLPVGLQLNAELLHLTVFAEAAAMLGDLPATHLTGTYSSGMRALF